MKAAPLNVAHSSAFTRINLIVVIAVLLGLAALIAVALSRERLVSERLCCNCNMKQIGAAYRIWANDRKNQFPSEAAAMDGGWAELVHAGQAGANCWLNYLAMSNELGQSPQLLICPTDKRKPAADFAHFTNNLSLSYFVGVGVDDSRPEAFLSGDRNLAPGTIPRNDYGYSPDDFQGNDVVISGPVGWSLKMHSEGNPTGFGNILLGDGSAQQVTSDAFRKNWLPNAQQALATNHLLLRLIFP